MLNAVSQRKTFDRYLTPDEEKQLLGHVGKFGDVLAKRDHAWMRLARHTGLRIGSISLLDVADAREALVNGFLRVRNEIAKRGHGYDVRLTAQSRDALEDLLRIQRKMQPQRDWVNEPLILCRRKHRISVRSLQARMAGWVRDSGLGVAASPHWFRHTFAKRIIKKSEAADPFTIAQFALGQASRQSTSVYTMPDREDMAAALERAAA